MIESFGVSRLNVKCAKCSIKKIKIMNLYSTVLHTQYSSLLISPVLWVCCVTQKHRSYLLRITYESREEN